MLHGCLKFRSRTDRLERCLPDKIVSVDYQWGYAYCYCKITDTMGKVLLISSEPDFRC